MFHWRAYKKYIPLLALLLLVFTLAVTKTAPPREGRGGNGGSTGEAPDDYIIGREAPAGSHDRDRPAPVPEEAPAEPVSSNPAPADRAAEPGQPAPNPEDPPGESAQPAPNPEDPPAEPEQPAPNPEDPPGESAKPAAAGSADPPAEPEQPEPPPAGAHDTYLNEYVQEVIATYSGHYPYLLNNDYANYNGVTENLYFDNKLLARAHPSGSRACHCVGITFEVFFKAMQARNLKLGLAADDFNGMTFEELFDFMLVWFVACGDKRNSNIEVAVEKYGLGKRISGFTNARPGDFMDISRSNGTGHTVIFQNWVYDNSGNITGVHYWSSQGSTGGTGYNTEYFDTSGRGNVLSNRVYIARVLPVSQYRSFR